MAIPTHIGRYEVLRSLGIGGMAQVFLAQDPVIRRQVAVKLLAPQFSHNEQLRKRFLHEAQMVAGLENPCIVPVYDFGDEAGRPYIVMRFMPNGTLSERVKKGPLTLHLTASIVRRLSLALAEAHEQNIVHRDLKPSNVLFDQRDESFLADFGIAKMLEGSGNMTSGIIGTPAYMSPEQAKGIEQIDGRSDIYALGILIFEMLTGKQPYDADTPMAIALKHITDPPPRIRDVMPSLPPGLEPFISRVMAKEPEDRYATTLELTDAFDEALRSSKAATIQRDPTQPSAATKPKGEALVEIKPMPVAEIETTDKALDPADINIITTHTAPVLALAAHGPSGLFASGGGDQRVLIWNGQTRTLRHSLAGHSSTVQALAFSPNGKLLASGGDDKSIYLWHVGNGTPARSLRSLPMVVSALAFSPDGSLLAAAGDNAQVHIYDVSSGQLRQQLVGQREWIRDLTFSPNGNLLASASSDQTVFLWDMGTGQPVRALSGRGGTMWCTVFLNNETALTGSHRGLIQEWELATGRCVRTINGPPTGVWSILLTGDRVLTAGFDMVIREWDWQTGQSRHTYEGHTRWVRRLVMGSAPNEFVSVSDDHTIRVWTLA